VVRPIEFEETKVLAGAMRCFWKQGYAATSMRDLEKVTGLSTGSIYNSFGNKDGLFVRALDHYVETIIDRRIEVFLNQDNAKTGILDFFKDCLDKPDSVRELGCLLVNTSVENHLHSQNVREKMKQAHKKVKRALQDTVVRGIENKQIFASRAPDQVAQHLVMLLSGILVRLRYDHETDWHKGTLELVLNILND
jgi:TetR/AcrR family transcriptional repressor of nem operon